jgi:carboxyl-terminal processing protease
MENSELTTEKQKKRIAPIILAVVITTVISVFISFVVFYFLFIGDSRYLKLKELDFLVNSNYYGKVDEDKVTDGMMSGYISGLGDRFAGYYDKESASDRSDSLKGNAKGIGIIITCHPDFQDIYINNVYTNSPAERAGLKKGDRITAVDSVPVTQMGYTKAVDSLLREIGDTVTLSLIRGDTQYGAVIEYAEFAQQSVFYEMLPQKMGYVHITAFNAETVAQFKNAVNQLASKGAKGLIFDLRSNGGGTVDSVTEMVDFICPEGDIMTVKYSNGNTRVLAKSDAEEIALPMVVLTNEQTASASELFTASVKDFGKGISIGNKTYGKGVMQTTYTLHDGSGVSFTVAEFFPHSGKSFNEKGISPDIEVVFTEKQSKYRNQLSYSEDPYIVSAVEHLTRNDK